MNVEKEEYCCVCEEKKDEDKMNKIKVKGKEKQICDECADTVHGLI